jgi:large subunit ribosomal protein L15
LHRRLPHFRGFRPVDKKEFAIVNLSALERFEDGTVVTPDLLISSKVIGEFKDGVKVLANGDLTKKLTVEAQHFSKAAQERIIALGGTVKIIERVTTTSSATTSGTEETA